MLFRMHARLSREGGSWIKEKLISYCFDVTTAVSTIWMLPKIKSHQCTASVLPRTAYSRIASSGSGFRHWSALGRIWEGQGRIWGLVAWRRLEWLRGCPARWWSWCLGSRSSWCTSGSFAALEGTSGVILELKGKFIRIWKAFSIILEYIFGFKTSV